MPPHSASRQNAALPSGLPKVGEKLLRLPFAAGRRAGFLPAGSLRPSALKKEGASLNGTLLVTEKTDG